ncbi:dermonecrotic toxin domain-containing protein [Pseudomonas sp. IT-P4]|uniref:dermonecrotic toxin domain-containing protein n=1 Tax=Pseudomonas sp. IT-P4 TaxID=3026446 RepID=UPI0039E0D12D
MVDETTPLAADFGLVVPLPANPDQGLTLSASERWNECCEQWRALMAQNPQSPLASTWWNARARGTDQSRRAQANRLYRQHFEASSQWAFARGILDVEQFQTLQAFIDPPVQTATPATALHYVEQMQFKDDKGLSIELSGALVITRDTAQPVAQLLYLPSRPSAWMTFESRVDMESWLIEHQPQMFDHPRLPTGTLRVYYTVLERSVLQTGAQSLWARLPVTPGDRLRNELILAPPANLPDADTNNDAVLFGQLSPDIPLGIRLHALAQQRTALDALLGDNFQGNHTDPRLQRLQRQMDELATAEQASSSAATALLHTDSAQQMLELRHKSRPHYAALYQARLDGLRAEAELQLSLNQISHEEHQWLISVLDAPDQPRPAGVVVARLVLSMTDTEGDTPRTQSQELDGVLLFAQPSALLPSSTESLLLYWPGRFGGLQRFTSRQALEQTLFKLAANDNSQALHLLPLAANPFEYALQNQLHGCVQQVARLLSANRDPSRASQRETELEKLREQTLACLTVPVHAARELAHQHIVEQVHSSALAARLPAWHGALPTVQRERIKTLFKSYIEAMKRSHEWLERELPPRDAFSKKAIDAHLRQAFGLTRSVDVLLDVPDATAWRKVVIEGAAPGTPQENVLVASEQRSKLSLGDLAQSNIDQAMSWRLSFMQVETSGGDPTDRQKLKTGITKAWLRKMATELDLAGQYETLIRETFLGTSNAPTFSNEYRHECLSEPWRLMLRLQGEFAVLAKDINTDGQQVLDIAIDANNRDAFSANGKRIQLLPAYLTVGGKDTHGQGPSTLSGVTFIVEQISGLTLLYLPDSPDSVFLRQFDSLEDARMRLFNDCLRSSMVNYLAGQALKGDVAHHVSRINQARLRNFDALIGVGTPWPASTSLAAHLLNVHMGRLLEAHRATSRSNDALYLEQVALQSGAMFNYLKMALGVVPFVGTAIALYDAWSSANLAVAAFLRGDVGHGLAEVEAVLLSLIDAAMDLLPGASAAPSAALAITRQRQLRAVSKSVGALRSSTQRQAQRTLERFKGYEYEQMISLAGLQPGTEGIYRNVYHHADGDFMLSQGRIYRIELEGNPPRWRLSGTSSRTYKQPIALDESGHWNTHYAVFGTVIEGGGVGGGAVLGHMADGLDPLWPVAIRRWLPRWWTDRALRRQLTLKNTAGAYTRRLKAQTRKSNNLMRDYFVLPHAQRPALRPGVDLACLDDIETAQALHRTLEEWVVLSHGNNRAEIKKLQSQCAGIVVDRLNRRIDLARERLLESLDRTEQLIARSDTTPVGDTSAHLKLMAERTTVRKAFVQELDLQHLAVEEARRWYRRITRSEHRENVTRTMELLNQSYSDANYHYLKAAHVLETITRYEAVDDLSWVYFHVQLKKSREKVGRALLTQYQLPQVSSSIGQRNRVFEDCLTTYSEFRRQLDAWTLGYPQHLDLEQVRAFLGDLDQMEAFARNAIRDRSTAPPPTERIRKQLFETEDNRLLIGEPGIDVETQQQHFIIDINGYKETWLPHDRHPGRYRLSEPAVSTQPALPTDVRPLLSEARKRLGSTDAYTDKVKGYAQQNTLPVDLEHMMSSEAAELTLRAQAIERLSSTEAVAQQLRTRADEMLSTGRTLRIEQSMNSKTPTEGYLDYLVEQQMVDIRKEGGLRDLGKRPDGRRDFLQEYEVRDLRHEPAQTLWYAHFHYTSAKPQFSDFVKGHLKRPEQRNLGLQWQKDMAASGGTVEAIWRGDIGKPLGNKLFSTL